VTDGRVLVVGSSADSGVLHHLTEELVRRQLDGRAIPLWLGSGDDEVRAALADEAVDGWVRAIVFVPVDAGLLGPAPLGPDDEWDDRCEHLLALGLHVAQAAHALMAGGGGQLVLVLPDLGLTGAAGHVALATSLEGLRALTKSAARQWGEAGINTAIVVAPSHLFDADAEEASVAGTIAEPDVEGIADVLAALLGPAGDALTGVTLPVDGGVLMVP
jgi:3-oxoacyl-[acyl-carrier protein] reductase